ncbi:MAG: hypothetical protein AVDCRST_MAG67-1088, partial [uncultured Solirubrobacteraceae bacterium]
GMQQKAATTLAARSQRGGTPTTPRSRARGSACREGVHIEHSVSRCATGRASTRATTGARTCTATCASML